MANPFNTSNTNLPQMNQDLVNLMNMFKSGGNPMQLLQSMAINNPQLQPIVQMIQNGGNPEQMVRQICQQRGIDVNQFMNQFK